MPTFKDNLHLGGKDPLVQTDDFASRSITTEKIDDGAVTEEKLRDGSVTKEKIATGAVTNEKLTDNSVESHHIAEGSVTEEKIVDGSVTGEKIAPGAITMNKIKDGTLNPYFVELDNAAADARQASQEARNSAQTADNAASQALLKAEQAEHTMADVVEASKTASEASEKAREASEKAAQAAQQSQGVVVLAQETIEEVQYATKKALESAEDADEATLKAKEATSTAIAKAIEADNAAENATAAAAVANRATRDMTAQATADHTRAENDHTRAEQEHVRAGQDHQTAVTDHQTFVENEQQRQATFEESEEGRASAFEASESSRQTVFDEKETVRDAANQAALGAAEKLNEHGEKLAELEGKTDSISKEATETEYDSIVIEDNDGNVVAEIAPDGANFKNLKSNGKDVLTEHQDISGLATKEEVEEKQDVIPEITNKGTYDEDDKVVFINDTDPDNPEEVAKINSDGITAKSYSLYNGAKLLDSSYESVEEIRTRYVKSMQLWKSLGVGMFIHWGVYSVLAGNYKGKNCDNVDIDFTSTNIAEWILNQARIPKDIYKSFQSGFNASNWNAESVAKMAYNAGMKYIVITSKHHDGFVLYDSDYADWSIKTTPSRNTILDELKEACDKYGLKFCIYFSQARDWTSEGGWGQEFYKNDGKDPYNEEQHSAYVKKTISIINEIIKRYNPYVLWYDGADRYPIQFYHEFLMNQLAKYPQIIVNDRLHIEDFGDFSTGEGGFYKGDSKYSEDCYTCNGSWGYNKSRDTEQYMVSAKTIIGSYILEGVCRNHNVLINIGPKGDGSIPSLVKKEFDDVATFVSKYGTFSDSSAINSKSFPNWGRMLQKGNVLKCYVYDKSSSITISGINTTFVRGVKVYDVENTVSMNNVEIVDEHTMVVSNIPIHDNNYPSVVDIEFSNSIISEVYSNIIDDQANTLSAIAFNILGSAWLEGFDNGNFQIASWTKADSIVSTFKYDGDTKDSVVSLTKAYAKTDKVTFVLQLKDLLDNSIQSSNVTDTVVENSVHLVKGHTYEVELRKTTSDWYNLKNIKFN